MATQFADVKISNLVQIKKFEPVINPEWIVDNDIGAKGHLISNYVMTEEIAQVMETMLESFTEVRASASKNRAELNVQMLKQAHLITGTYGTGKSYLLLMLLGMFKGLSNPKLFGELTRKFSEFPYLVEHLTRLQNKKYLAVCINAQGLGGDVSFKDLITRGLITQYQKETGEALTLNSEFDTALRVLERMKALFASHMPPGETLQSLQHALQARKRAALPVFRAVFQRITHSQPDTYGTDVDTILSDAVKQVKSKGYHGVVFIVDEFSQYLSASMAAGAWAQDLAQLQLFADKVCNDLRNRVYLIASVHEELTKVGSMTDTDRNKLEVVLDRFRNHPLPYVNYAKLISGIFSVDKAKLSVIARRTIPNHDTLQALAKPTGADYQDYFPLHPSIISHLPIVSRKLASSQRTMFLFLAEYVSGKRLEEPLVNRSNELNLVGLVDMMDWFWPDLSKRGYDNVLQAANIMLQYFPEGSVARQVVKLLVALYIGVAGNDNLDIVQYSVTAHDVSQLLMSPVQEVQTILTALESKQEGVVQRNADGRYYFSTQIAPPVRPIINKYLDQVNVDQALMEQIKTGLPLVRARYSLDVDPWSNIRVPRTISGRQVALDHFLSGSFNAKVPEGADGLFILVVPSLSQRYTQTELATALDSAKTIVDKRRNVMIGLPKSMAQLVPHDIRWLEAVQIARQKVTNDDQMTIGALDKEFKSAHRNVRTQLNSWLQDANFLYVSAAAVSGHAGHNAVMKAMVKEWYFKFPDIQRESLKSGAVKDMGNRILLSPDNITTPLESNAQIEGRNGHLLKTLVPLGLARFKEETGKFIGHLTEPSSGSSLEIWQILLFGYTQEQAENSFGAHSAVARVIRGEVEPAALSPAESSNLKGLPANIEQTYETLKSNPYGLSDEFIELYIVCLVGLGKVRLRGGLQNGLTLKDISLKKDKTYRFARTNSLSPEKRLYLRNVLDLLAEVTNRPLAYPLVPTVGPVDEDKLADEMKLRFRAYVKEVMQPCKDALRSLGAPDRGGRALEVINELVNTPESSEFLARAASLGVELAGTAMDLDAGYTKTRNTLMFYSDLRPQTTALLASVKRFRVMPESADLDAQYLKIRDACTKNLERLVAEGSLGSIDLWLKSFEKHWAAFVERYNQEHLTMASTYRELTDSITSAPELAALHALSSFGLDDVAGPAHVRAHLNQFRPCSVEQPLTSEYLTAVDTSCTSCKYTLGKVPDVSTKAKEGRNILAQMLVTAVQKAAERILYYCDEASTRQSMISTFPTYLITQGLKRESSTILATLSKIMARQQVSDDELQTLNKTGKFFQKYMTEASRKKTAPVTKKHRVRMSELLDQAKTQLVASGSAVMTIEDVTSTITRFLSTKYQNHVVQISEGEGND